MVLRFATVVLVAAWSFAAYGSAPVLKMSSTLSFSAPSSSARPSAEAGPAAAQFAAPKATPDGAEVPSHPVSASATSTARSTVNDDDDDADQDDGSDQDDDSSDQQRFDEARHKPYVVDSVPGDTLNIPPPELPDLTPYTAEKAMQRVQRHPRGKVVVASVLGAPVFRSFMGRDGRMRDWASRQHSLPQAIFIREGYVTPKDIARALPDRYFEQTAPGVYVARLPIDVGPHATLHVDTSVKSLRLSRDRGAFLVNEGTLFITDSQVIGWDEAHSRPSTFVDKHQFRPFLVSWGGSQTYIIKSTVAHLGYAASKSYGISISQFSPSLAPLFDRPDPGGWLIDSEFYDNWYGFYCYEADGVVVRGNDYHDNIKYGIDPHDRSRHLIIAENKAHGTRIKHGIIVSREVNDSWIFSNKSYDNALSGIVVDRNSVNDVVALNQVYRNHADGITIYESPKTLIWKNLLSGNRRHGIRVRNSTQVRLYGNVAVANGLAGIYGHIKDLTGTGRNIHLDPFSERISMTVVGGQLVSNGSGPVTIDQPLSLELYDVDLRAPQRSLGIKFTGILGAHQEQVLEILMQQKRAVIIRPEGYRVTSAN